MKIACTYKNYYGTDTLRWIDEAVSYGYTAMEIATCVIPDAEAVQDEVVTYALSHGLTLNLHAPYGINNISSADGARRASSIANVKRDIDLAAKYSLGVVTFHPGRLSYEGETPEENMARMMEVIADIVGYAKEKRVFVAIENMELRPNELIYTVDDLNLFAPLAEDNPYFGVTIDFAHYSSHGIGLPDLSRLALPIYDVHLSQNVGGKMHCALTAEGGSVDLSEVCRSLTDYGYEGLVVLEVLKDIRGSREALARLMEGLNK